MALSATKVDYDIVLAQLRDLHAGDPETRRRAIATLVRQGYACLPDDLESSVLPALVAAARDPDPSVRHEAVCALPYFAFDFSGFFAAVLARLADSDPDVREAAVGVLTRAPVECRARIAKALAVSLRDSSSTVRRLAAHAIGTFGEQGVAAIPDLMPLLRRERPVAPRTTAARALGEIGLLDPSEVRQMGAVLANADRRVAVAVVQALARLGNKAKVVLPSLLGACQPESLRVRRLALDLSAELALDRDDVVLALVRALMDHYGPIRDAAAGHLRRLVQPDG